MATVDIKSNPVVAKIGALDADATEIISDLTASAIVFYQIQNEDDANDEIFAVSTTDYADHGNVISCTTEKLKVILKGRTKYRARVRAASYGEVSWGAWVRFKTRDKRYQSPDATASLTDDTNDTATVKGSRRIVVTNNAKAQVTIDNELLNKGKKGERKRGATVKTSPESDWNEVTKIRTSQNGQLVVADKTIVYTNRGATIDNR